MRVRASDVLAAMGGRTAAPIREAVASRAAVAVILRETAPGLEMLFIRRAEHEQDPWSGHISFPGGRAEPGDLDLVETARRETLEEIGIDLARDADLLGELDHVRAMARGRPVDLAIAPFVFCLRRAAVESLGPEVASVHWLPLETLVRPETEGRFEYRQSEQVVDLPCLRLEGLVIWGLTYRMFAGFRERLRLTIAEGDRLEAGSDLSVAE